MDPLSVSASAAALITICVQAVQLLKRTIEALRNAKDFLLKLLSQTERVRLFLEQLRSLTKQLGQRSEILLAFNESEPRATINELNVFVNDIAQKTAWVRLRVLLNQSAAEKFLERLHRHEEEIMQVLLSVATASAIRTEDEIRKMHEDVMFHARVTSPFSSSVSTLVDATGATLDESKPFSKSASQTFVSVDGFDSIEPEESIWEAPKVGTVETDMTPKSLLGETPNVNQMYNSPPTTSEPVLPNVSDAPYPKKSLILEESLQTSNKLQIWLGDLSRSGFDDKYLSWRDKLSDAAFRGDFNTVLHILTDVERTYQQSWANAPRLSATPQHASGWTPLHQAVYMGASKQEIIRLVQDFGALRLLRTVWTDPSELPHRNMTAAEIARNLGYTDLYTVLAPIIYHCLPHAVLTTLQAHFHDLIRDDLRARPHEIAELRLPELVVLTELKVPLMWLPLKPEGPKKVRGYMYRLDGRELLVKTLGVGDDDGNVKLYRISEGGPLNIEEAIAFNL